MTRRLAPIFVLLLASIATSRAARPAPPQVETAPAKNEPVPPYELKSRSVFAVTADTSRAPFWPIGWVKRARSGPVTQSVEAPVAKITIDEKSFRVTSILIGSGTTPSLAVINGRAYSEGEYIRMPKTPGTASPRIRVQRINDGTVVLQNADQRLVASLQHQELNSKRPEELLLDPDR